MAQLPSNESGSRAVKVIRYGILGCAGIAAKIARAIDLETGSQVTFVASRDRQVAQNFCLRNCAQAKSGTYSELIDSDLVDVVYIPIPTAVRLPWIIKAIGAKKHVLCEKPIGSPRNMELIIPSCRAKNVQFMDGIEFMHHPRFKDLTNKIHRQKYLGKIMRVISSFSVPCLDDSNIRNQPELEPLGVLGDLGIHNIRLSLWAFDYEPPRFVKAVCHKRNAKGAIQDISVWLFFSEDKTAQFDCSYHCPLRQHAEMVGQTGTIEIRQFVIPNEKKCSYTMNYSTLNAFDTTENIREITFEDAIQEVEMISRMSHIARTGKLETFWPNVSLVTEQILDAVRRSLDKDGALVEFIKNQLWFEMTHANRRFSVTGSREHVFGSVHGVNLAEFQNLNGTPQSTQSQSQLQQNKIQNYNNSNNNSGNMASNNMNSNYNRNNNISGNNSNNINSDINSNLNGNTPNGMITNFGKIKESNNYVSSNHNQSKIHENHYTYRTQDDEKTDL